MGLKDSLTPDPRELPPEVDEVDQSEPQDEIEPGTEPEEPVETDPAAEEPAGDEEPGADEPVHEEEPEDAPPESPKEPKPVEGETPREKAMRLEIARLKRERREGVEKPREMPPVPETPVEETPETVTRTEAMVLNSMQDDALQSFLDEHPIYKSDDKLWNSFLAEFKDRRSMAAIAKEQGKPVTRSMIRERLNSIHRSVVGVTNTEEQARKRARTTARAAIAVRQSQGGAPSSTGKQKTESVLPRKSGISTWVTKK